MVPSELGIRIVNGIDPVKLRMFLMSLLWRAAASAITAMSEIEMPAEDLQALTSYLIGEGSLPLSFYPAQLVQLSTRGPMHNLSPIKQTKRLPPLIDGGPVQEIPIFRLYFDGLIIHFHRQSGDENNLLDAGPLIVGAENRLAVVTKSYDTSFQSVNILHAVVDARIQFGETVDRLSWPPRKR